MKKFVVSAALLLLPVSASAQIIELVPGICKIPSVVPADGVIPAPEIVAKDAYCARELMRREAPEGAITIFGSARLKPEHPAYQLTREFAKQWAIKAGARYPILTGGGGGLMEAGNRGAFDAKVKNLGIGTRFSSGQEKPNPYVTHYYLAGSFGQREADLVDYARAIVIAPGGFGTEWELFESLSKIQTKKKNPVPVILLGQKSDWVSLQNRLDELAKGGTISPEDLALVQSIATAEEAVSVLSKSLGL